MEATNTTPEIRIAMLEYFNRKWLPIHSSENDIVLYHYTNMAGLRGIINDRSIWFSHTKTLNDPLEIKYGQDLIISILDEYLVDQDNVDILSLIDGLKTGFKAFNVIDYHTYVACFCSIDNLLSQWRNYGGDGGGVNVGIFINDQTKFYHDLDNNISGGHIILRKVIYDPEEQIEYVKSYMDIIISASRDGIKNFEEHGGLPDGWASTTSMDVVNVLFDFMLTFKNPVYKEENEWRLIKSMQTDCRPEFIRFRGSKNIIPYINTNMSYTKEAIEYFPIRSIKYGHSRDLENIKSIIKLFLMKEEKSNHKIKLETNSIEITGAGFETRD